MGFFWRRVRPGALPGVAGPHKWLPRIDRDSCAGCGRCVAACPAGCLQLVWSFSTLMEPAACTSCGLCAEACPERLITLDWLPADGPRDVGLWREECDRAE